MTKIDKFKQFIYNHPEFIDYVKNNNTSWQSLYELYDIYGENTKVWDKYLNNKTSSVFDIKSLLNTIKNIDLNSLEENINNIQKAVGLVEEFTKSEKEEDKKESKEVHEEKIDNLYGE